MSVCLLGADKNPASKVYITDVVGEASVFIPVAGNIKDTERKDVYNAEGLVFDTKKKSNQTMVLSNGSGVYMDENTHLEIKKFVQEPFTPNRTDMDVEPSISQTKGHIPHGYVAICTSKIVAGSSMAYDTPIGTIKLFNNKVVIDVQDDKTIVISVEGDAKVDLGINRFEYVKPGQKATITKDGIKISDATKEELEEATEKVAFACKGKKDVYFDVRENGAGSEKEIKAISVVPKKLPTEFTISPSTLD